MQRLECIDYRHAPLPHRTVYFHQPRRPPAVLSDHFHPEVRDARPAQCRQVGQGAQRPYAEDGVPAADVGHDRVHLSGAITKRDPVTIAWPATGAEVGAIAEERREDTMLCVKERQVVVNRYLAARGAGAEGDRVHQVFELFAVQIHSRRDTVEAEPEQDLHRVRVHSVQRDIADEKRECEVDRPRRAASRPLRELRAQPAQTLKAPEAPHQNLLRPESEQERLDPLLARLLHTR